MRKVQRIEGTAFTKRKSTHDVAETPDEIMGVFRQIGEWAEDPWAEHRRHVEAAREALEREIAGKPEGYRFKPHEETGWYLDRLVMLGHLVQHHIDQGAPSWAAHEAALFGETFCELQMKLAREREWTSGKDSRDGSRDGAAKRAEAFKPRHAEIRADFEARLNRHGDGQRAKNATARAFEISRRQLNRILAK